MNVMVVDFLYNAKGKLKVRQFSWTFGPKQLPVFLSLSAASAPTCFLLTPLLVVHGALCRCFSHTVETFPNVSAHFQALLIWEKEKLERKNEFLDSSYFLLSLSKVEKKLNLELFTFPTLLAMKAIYKVILTKKKKKNLSQKSQDSNFMLMILYNYS